MTKNQVRIKPSYVGSGRIGILLAPSFDVPHNGEWSVVLFNDRMAPEVHPSISLENCQKQETPKHNWNDYAIIEPSELGWKIWYKHFQFQSLGLSVEAPEYCKVEGGSKLRLQLWEIAHIFGPHLYNGCRSPFVSMNFELENNTSKEV